MKRLSGFKILISILILVLIAASLACNFSRGGKSESTLAEDFEGLEAALAADKVDDRPGVLEYLGRPDAFDIAVVEVEGVNVRMES